MSEHKIFATDTEALAAAIAAKQSEIVESRKEADEWMANQVANSAPEAWDAELVDEGEGWIAVLTTRTDVVGYLMDDGTVVWI